jgi:hypothetical protein
MYSAGNPTRSEAVAQPCRKACEAVLPEGRTAAGETIDGETDFRARIIRELWDPLLSKARNRLPAETARVARGGWSAACRVL